MREDSIYTQVARPKLCLYTSDVKLEPLLRQPIQLLEVEIARCSIREVRGEVQKIQNFITSYLNPSRDSRLG